MSKASKRKLTEVLQELKSEYLLKFPRKIIILKELTERQKWLELEEEYHKLKGSGKTYGYPEISIICQKLESLLNQKPLPPNDIFEQAILLFEKMHQGYLANKPLDLQSDPFARTLLALKVK